MKITYIAHARFPVEKAYGKQIAEVCSALTRLEHQVSLVCPTVINNTHESPASYYGLPETFDTAYLHHFDASRRWWIPGFFRFFVTMIFYRKAVARYLVEHETDLIYMRSPLILGPALSSGKPVVLELHTLPNRGRAHFVSLCNQCRKVVCLTSAMKSELVEWGVDSSHIIVEADGVDLTRFEDIPPTEETRKRLYVPDDRPVIGYVGSLITQNTIEKGVAVILTALAVLKEQNIKTFGLIVGGPRAVRDRYEQKALASRLTTEDVRLIDRVPATEVPGILTACDVLVYPAPASNHPYFMRDTSPLKLFEYLAAERPIVCADIPPVRDVVDESLVTFFTPGDPTSLADTIDDVLDKKNESQRKVTLGREAVQKHSWERRMERVLASLM